MSVFQRSDSFGFKLFLKIVVAIWMGIATLMQTSAYAVMQIKKSSRYFGEHLPTSRMHWLPEDQGFDSVSGRLVRDNR